MVFEEILKAKAVKKKPVYALFLGVIFPLIAYFTSLILFRNAPAFIPISTLLFTVLIALPTLNKLLAIE